METQLISLCVSTQELVVRRPLPVDLLEGRLAPRAFENAGPKAEEPGSAALTMSCLLRAMTLDQATSSSCPLMARSAGGESVREPSHVMPSPVPRLAPLSIPGICHKCSQSRKLLPLS